VTFKIKSRKKIAIKICGLTQPSQAKAIAEMRVNAIGVIGVRSSERFVSASQRERIFTELKPYEKNIERVLVVSDQTDSEFDAALQNEICPTVFQLHGNESQERCAYLREKYPTIKWWKALRIKEEKDLAQIYNFEDIVDAILIDAWSSKNLGGTGKRIPLSWIKQIKIKAPWWIAGGISQDWIPKILENTKPYGIDASSRLETSPGIKDLEKVNLLIRKIREIS